jgi:hypothetical protein
VRTAAFEDVLAILQPSSGVLAVTGRQLLAAMSRHVVSAPTLVKAHAEAQALFPPAPVPSAARVRPVAVEAAAEPSAGGEAGS